MAIAIDTSVLLDVRLADPTHGQKSRAALQNAAAEGLIISETGSSRGVVIRVLKGGKLIWKSDATGAALAALPESVTPE